MLNEKQQRLKEILENNINNETIGTAIAITGSWGVGKTYFWNDFRKNNPLKQKYVYVSLFGLESLNDLKTHIYSNIENNHSILEIPRWIRGLPSIFKDTRISQFGINASAKVFDSLMFNQVKDAIICFDDFERMSNKLDIKDVMGLANQLKLEKNCQIILILDETKTEDKNKEKYSEYKEKLIDETIKITSVEPLIRANAKDIDERLVDLMVKFADELDIHNFRFFQKIIKLYHQFLAQLPNEVATSTKEIILVRILHGYLIEDFGEKLDLSWQDINLNNEFGMLNFDPSEWSESKKKTYESLESLSGYFVRIDKWATEYKKWFEQKDRVDTQELSSLANSELLSEKNNIIKEELSHLMNQWRNIDVDQNYCDQLFGKSFESIVFNSLTNLSFHCFLLKKFGRNDLSRSLKRAVINWLNQELQENYEYIWDEVKSFGYDKENLFHWYIKRCKVKNPQAGLPSLFDVIKAYIQDGSVKSKSKLVLENVTQHDWESLFFGDMLRHSELKKTSKINLLRGILQIAQREGILPSIQQTIKIILQNKIIVSVDVSQQKNIEFVMEILKKEGLL
ncbi:KAP family P-loop domain protein [Acinetobacter defluvii]|uniref:KAP family P-loop domain protein n=1 Tax=Acinetobacter defluvii TaxID=1871111 RepID=UPI0014905A3E|nr:KAP family P-loop domain protein [Acinetobacter defluvii]NNP74365.1 KAP family P-loop domain protein [Acinetobacter defluvii]